uniref:Uncharacterized protein n=1 Tax=Picea glauca TaxID=3330 RepID=A0A117NIX9_PICGL|nr:hypothetical protein ABT39_MTgene517 [Picea glauca]
METLRPDISPWSWASVSGDFNRNRPSFELLWRNGSRDTIPNLMDTWSPKLSSYKVPGLYEIG